MFRGVFFETVPRFLLGQLWQVNNGLLRRYFVEFGFLEPNSGFLGSYFWKKARKPLIWGSHKENKAFFDTGHA
ncbi:hypothetical protein J25TS5_44180 [Paenibacillus faecis]|nr:hypothetical protein J25TS5_44180 [Paenibacillus faecis]